MLLCLNVWGMQSCNKNEDGDQTTGPVKLNVNISSVEYQSNTPTLTSTNKVGKTVSHTEIPLGKGKSLAVSVKANSANKESFVAATNGVTIKENLKTGVYYRLLVFDKDSKYVASLVYQVGHASTQSVSLAAGEQYQFIVYSLGKEESIPAMSLQLGDSMDKAILELSTTEDVMFSKVASKLMRYGDNNLSVTLKHAFNAVSVTLNANEIGAIQNVGDLQITNIFNSVILELGGAQYYPSNITCKNLQNVKTLNPFIISSDKSQMTSSNSLFFVDGNKTQSLILQKLTIDGVEKSNLKIAEFTAEPGVFYEVIINLKKTKPEGFEINGLIWANGNLVLNNDKYEFAQSQGEFGDYWFKNSSGAVYNTPWIKNSTNKASGSVSSNICAKVGDGWRLPTVTETRAFQTFTNWYGSPSNKYVGTYVDAAGNKVKGIFIGTNVQPSALDQDKYLFLPFAGAVNSGSISNSGSMGVYWHNGTGGSNGTDMQLAEYYMTPDNNGGFDMNRANSIRCVKTK